jgi:predicted RNA binding protein YcfA (HicA-like mRNA interferase family)
MSRLPSTKPKRLAIILQRLGFVFIRQKGSHAIFRHPDGRQTIIPMHPKELYPGTLHGILKDAKLEPDDLK